MSCPAGVLCCLCSPVQKPRTRVGYEVRLATCAVEPWDFSYLTSTCVLLMVCNPPKLTDWVCVCIPRLHLRSLHVCIFRFSLCLVWNISMICCYPACLEVINDQLVVANCWVLCIMFHILNEFYDCVLWHSLSNSSCWGKGCTHCTEAWGEHSKGLK